MPLYNGLNRFLKTQKLLQYEGVINYIEIYILFRNFSYNLFSPLVISLLANKILLLFRSISLFRYKQNIHLLIPLFQNDLNVNNNYLFVALYVVEGF